MGAYLNEKIPRRKCNYTQASLLSTTAQCTHTHIHVHAMYHACTMYLGLGGAMAKNVLTIHVRHVYIDEEDISVNKEEISCSRD